MASAHKDILKRTVEALEASLRRYPDSPKIVAQLAQAYSTLGRFDPAALEVYNLAASSSTDVKILKAASTGMLVGQSTEIPRSATALAELDLAALARSIERLQQLTAEFPDSPHLHRALGDYLLLQGDERESVHHYRCALALGYTDIQSLCDQFENVRRLRELSGFSGVFFAELYQRLNRLPKAQQIFQHYMTGINPERVVLDKYAEFLQRRVEEAEDRETYQQCVRLLARISLLKGNFGEGLTWARQLSPAQVARDERLAKDLARRLMGMEDYRLAFEYLSKIHLDDETKSLLNDMTVLLEKRGELDTAVYILQYINENDELAQQSRQMQTRPPEQNDRLIEVETELQMAELHWKNRRWEQALEKYIRVLQMGYEDYRNILEPLDMLIPKVPDLRPDHMVFLANYFADHREWRRALAFAGRALRMDPSQAQISQRLLQSCERILIESPDDLDVRLVFGEELLRMGNIERAIGEFRRCAESPEYKIKATRRLATANYRAGDLNGALERYRDIPVLEGEDLERLYDIAIAFANTSQFREAYETAKLIREYDSGFRDIEAKLVSYEEKMNENNVGFVIDPKMRELIGDHSIGRYKYMSKIGSGGMGVVHKVLDLKSGQVVAMKILREGLSSSGKAIDRFFREARIAATLHHKNIVNILDYNISNNYGQSYIAMEFVDGPSLRDIIEKKFAETVDVSKEDVLQALDWSSQLCDALDATHKKGIIHRDIKPDNVLIAAGDWVKITDFGIVHIEEATFTPTGALIGTPRYMSPEQVHGGRIDARSDIYAVGIIMYEMLIGSPPFISGDISYQQVNVMPTPPREICPVIPASVDRIIMKCLAKATTDRYQSAVECKQDIDEAYIRLGGQPRRRPGDDAGKATPSTVRRSETQAPLWKDSPAAAVLPNQRGYTLPKRNPSVGAQENIETPSRTLPQRVIKDTRSMPTTPDWEVAPPRNLDTDLDLH